MLKIHYSYKDPTYHKEDDPPWVFPPKSLGNEYESNIIEIQGKNGSGKSTLLNIIALAYGYLKYDNELSEKQILKDKLRQLDEFDNLEYTFSTKSHGKNQVEIQINKDSGNRKRIILNGKNVSEEELDKFDVIFLTEDDPRKVVTVSIGKVNNFLKTLEKRVNNTAGKILQYNSLVNAYNSAKKDQADTLKRVEKSESIIQMHNRDSEDLKKLKDKVDLRNELKDKHGLITDEDKINEEYWQLKREVNKLDGKDIDKIIENIIKEENKIQKNKRRLSQVIDPGIREYCIQLNALGIELDTNKILNEDYMEAKKLDKYEKEESRTTDEYQLKLVQDLIKTLGKHPSDLKVPTINKSVSVLLKDLVFSKNRLSSGSIRDKITQLKKQLKTRKSLIKTIERAETKVSDSEKAMEGFDDFKIIKQEFDKIENRYLDLKKLSNVEKILVLEEYKKLEAVIGNSDELETQIREAEVKKSVEQQMLGRLQDRLENIKENMSKKPKYAEQEELIRTKYQELFSLSKKIRRWITIIENPQLAKQEYSRKPDDTEFGLSDYNRFVQSMGHYLGQMFEPVTFSGQVHIIEFYDIELERFRTDEKRFISIQDLSVGQNKITALETSLKNLDPNKKGVVLIDEIADLDNENMGRVRKVLKQYYQNERIQFAILVRPLLESNTGMVKILEL